MSRLNVQMDGGMLAGGCGGRMDPPTAYVFPQSFDRIRVLKGPQSLEQGATLAGTVLFERDRPEFTAPGLKADASALYGSFGRDDQMVDMTAGSTDGYLRGQFTHSDSDDYRDGHGNKVRSFYRRENGTAQLGWTPGEHTWLELTAERSNARAAYADRTMDGPMFDRESFGLKLKQEQITTHWQRSELTLWDNYIDHIMDNFSLRQNSGMKMLSNPDRRNTGGRWANDIALPADWLLTAGFDSNRDQHRFRKDLDYADKPRQRTLRFEQQGGFAELGRQQGAHSYKGGIVRIGSRQPVMVRGIRPSTARPSTSTAGLVATSINGRPAGPVIWRGDRLSGRRTTGSAARTAPRLPSTRSAAASGTPGWLCAAASWI